MTDLFERGGHIRLSWQDRFKDKWPYMTTLMYQNDGSNNLDSLNNGQSVGPPVSVENLQRETGWPHHQQDVWSDRRILDHNKVESDVSSSSSKHKKGCYKACNIALCVFLIITIVTAACAGIGLAILLNGGDEDDFVSYDNTNGDNHLGGFLSPDEEIYLSKQFCDLVKVLMKSSRYPVKDGIDHCYAVLKLIRGSEELHIEMHVQPKARYTMKEKLRRALREQKLAEGSYRINGTNTCLKTTSGFPSYPCDVALTDTKLDNQVSIDKPSLTMDENYFRKDFKSIRHTPVLQSLQPEVVQTLSDQPISNQMSDLITNKFSITRLGSLMTETIRPSVSFVSADIAPNSQRIFSSYISSSTVSSAVLESSSVISQSPDQSPALLNTSREIDTQFLSESYSTTTNDISSNISSGYSSSIFPVESVQIRQTKTSEPSMSLIKTKDKEEASSLDNNVESSPYVLENYSKTFIQPSSSSKSSDRSSEKFSSTETSTIQPSEVLIRMASDDNNANDTASIVSTPLLLSSTSDIISTSIYAFDTTSVTPSSSSYKAPSSSVIQDNLPPKIYKPKPFQTIAKTQIQVSPPKLSEFHHKQDTSTLSNIESTTMRVPRIVENLMLGGVVKLPFKTTSQFRFLFANSPNKQAVSPAVVTKQRVNRQHVRPASTTNAYNFSIVKKQGAAKVRFTPTISHAGQGLERNAMPRVLRQQSAVERNKTPPPIFGGSTQRKAQTLARFFSGENYMNGVQGRGR